MLDEQYKKETYKMIVCAPDHPNRCPSPTKDGQRQCGYLAVQFEDGSYGKHCLLHGGGNEKRSNQKAEQKNYKLGKWQNRVGAFADNPAVKSLREEIGITRMILEEVIGRCPDEASLLMESPRIGDLVTKLEKLVISCHKLEASTGMLLDKTSAIHIASRIVEIISKNISDADIIDKISEEIITVIIGQKNDS